VALGIQLDRSGGRLVLGTIKELEPDARGVPAKECKVDPIPSLVRTQGQGTTHPHLAVLGHILHVLRKYTLGHCSRLNLHLFLRFLLLG
jgi:hypothetical protein